MRLCKERGSERVASASLREESEEGWRERAAAPSSQTHLVALPVADGGAM